MKDFDEEKRKLLEEERAKTGRETSLMRSKLKSVTHQMGVMNNVLKELKREQQELRISCLKLGTGIKPAVREAVKKVNVLLVFNLTMQGEPYHSLMLTCNNILQSNRTSRKQACIFVTRQTVRSHSFS